MDLGGCLGDANCGARARQIFDVDDEIDRSLVVFETVPAALEPQLRRAEVGVPVRAISVRE